MTGIIETLDPRGFGFIVGADGARRMFHAKRSLSGITFEELHKGMVVSFKPVPPRFGKGPRAESVMRVVNDSEQAAA